MEKKYISPCMKMKCMEPEKVLAASPSTPISGGSTSAPGNGEAPITSGDAKQSRSIWEGEWQD